MSLRAFRVGIVGARKARHGVGAHLARFLHAAGTRVVAVAGTSMATAATAAHALAPAGITATPYDDVPAMIGAEALDALVVASPPATHVRCLGLAREAGLHVLCEKPFLPPDVGSAFEGARFADAFAAKGLLLAVNVQWRHALGAYMQLFPDVTPRAATSFEMELSPAAVGRQMVPDALPHPLSVLDHLFPARVPGLRDIEMTWASPERATIRFRHPGGVDGIGVELRLSTVYAQPRPFAFGFDGRLARREIEEPGYRFFLRAAGPDGRRVPLPDPMDAVVRRFVERVRKGPPFPPDPVTLAGLVHLEELAVAAARVAPAGGRG